MGKNLAKDNKIIAAFLGTIVEYYDYSLYGFSAGIIATKFFPEQDIVTSLMYVFAIYSAAYLMKPIGSLFFSFIGDIYGRKASLRITIIGIALPTLTIGLLPEYNNWGAFSAAILVCCRLMQGFFVAGEYDGAAIYVIEHFGKRYHYTASAITRSTGVAGLLLGIASTNFFNSSLFPEWGWRIPFLISLPLALVTMYYRRYLEETPEFTESSNKKVVGTLSFLRNRFKTLLAVICFTGSFGAMYQISIIFMKQYLPLVVPQISTIISSISVTMVFAFGIAMPVAGIVADKFGKNIVITVSLILAIICTLFLMVAVKYQMINLVIIAALGLSIMIAPINALAHGVIIKSFAVNERYRGISLGHTIGSMLLSGSANYVCLAVMKSLKWNLFPIIYIVMCIIISYFAYKQLIKP